MLIPCFFIGLDSISRPSDTTKNIEIYFFLQPDCPISQQYTPVINAFHAKEEKHADIKSIKIIFSTKERAGFEQLVGTFIEKYKVNLGYQIDKGYRIAKKLHATVSPEVFLLLDGKIKYHGAIDNMYARLGVKRQETTEFYLEQALDAIRNGLPLPYTYKEPLGCFIEY